MSLSPPSHETTQNTEEYEDYRPQKRFKITASNGRRVLQEMENSHKTNAKFLTKNLPRRVGTKGKLARLVAMPLDILFEILGHLLPIDILHLTRTSKEFRSVLLSKAAICIWRSALANVPDLPACPPEMSLPAWANLVFDTHCHNCWNANARNVVDFILRVRLCGKCVKTCLVSAKTLDAKQKKAKLILRCVPFSHWAGRGIKYCLLKEKQEFAKLLSRPDSNFLDLIKARKAEIKTRIEHSKKCQRWLDRVILRKRSEQDGIRQKREEAISKKLRELGFGDELDYLRDLAQGSAWPPPKVRLLHEHPDVRTPKPLTERIWSNIKQEMIDYMGTIKVHRAEEERLQLIIERKASAQNAWSEWRQEHITTDLMPSPVDVLIWEPVKSTVESPSEVIIDESTFTRLFEQRFIGFLNNWRIKQLRNVAALCDYGEMPKMWPNPPVMLQLAVCVFSCSTTIHMQAPDYDPYRCCLMWYPEFLHHPCNSICRLYDDDDEEEEREHSLDANSDLRVSRMFDWCRRRTWTSDKLVFAQRASRTVRNILAACNLDHEKTTVQDLDKLDHRLVCLKCSFGAKPDGERRFTIWSWRNAVQHSLKVHWGDSRVEWQRLSAEDEVEAKSLEAKELINRGITAAEKIWRCIGCIDLPSDRGKLTMEEMRHHRDRFHRTLDKQSEMKEGVHYYRSPESPPSQPLPVQIVPGDLEEVISQSQRL